ncbi:MAG: NADH-quinone oxidoreductase subunit L, partial [Candidatus Omnitrophica bacterium]|nr:NADH-quinone oxidoreductase subunit L [Candidatus Omnitrophota bacterium]
WLGTLTAGMTAFYIARAWFVAFTGKARGHPHESPPVMIGPLVLLAALSIVGGYLGIPRFLGEHGGAFHWAVAGMSLAVVAAGLVLAWLIYGKQAISAQQLVHALALPYSFLQRRYYIDEIYAWYVAVIQQKLIAGLCAWVERHVIIGLAVNGTARLTQDMGRLIRLCQTGRIQTYALAFLIGIVWLLSIPIRH